MDAPAAVKLPPPSYDQSEGMSNSNYAGPAEGQGQPYPQAGQPYPQAGQPYPQTTQPYPQTSQPYPQAQPYVGVASRPVYVHAAQMPGSSVHYVSGVAVPMVQLVQALPLGPGPTTIKCPRCGVTVITNARTEPNIMAYVACSLLCVFGCFMGCCLIPFFMSSCQDVHHSCPNCNSYVGKFSRA